MDISVSQVHNVLRTYRHLFNEGSHQGDRKAGEEADREPGDSFHDPVSLSPESIERLEEAEKNIVKPLFRPKNKARIAG